ncbi:phosphatase domain-containing putative toxin [Nostoc sp.]
MGNAVAVHCTSGRRRIGTILASYLIYTGSSYTADCELMRYKTTPP